MIWSKKDIQKLCSFVDKNGKIDSVGSELYFKKSRKSIAAVYFSNKEYILNYVNRQTDVPKNYKWNKRKVFDNAGLIKNIRLSGIRYNKPFSIFVSIEEVDDKIEKYAKLGVVLKQI